MSFFRVQEEPTKNTVILGADVQSVPVLRHFQPHLISGTQFQNEQEGGLVYLLTIERLPGLELLLVAGHKADSSRSAPDCDVIGEHIRPWSAAVKLPCDGVVMALVIGENLVKFDGNVWGRKRLGQQGTKSRLWNMRGLALGALDPPGALLPSRPSSPFAPQLALWPGRSG